MADHAAHAALITRIQRDKIARAIHAAHAALIARNQRDMARYGPELPDGD